MLILIYLLVVLLLVIVLVLILIFLIIDDLDLISSASEDMVSPLLGLQLSHLSLHSLLGKPLFLDPVDVVVKVLGDEDVTEIGNQVRINSNHLDHIGMICAQVVYYLDA